MDKRYEFSFDEQINGGGKDELKGIVIDVCPKGCEPMASNKPMIIFQSEDKGKAIYLQEENKQYVMPKEIGLN